MLHRRLGRNLLLLRRQNHLVAGLVVISVALSIAVPRAVHVVPEVVVRGEIAIRHHSTLVVRHVGQGKSQLLPKQFIAPLQIGVRFEIQSDVGIKIFLRYFAEQNNN